MTSKSSAGPIPAMLAVDPDSHIDSHVCSQRRRLLDAIPGFRDPGARSGGNKPTRYMGMCCYGVRALVCFGRPQRTSRQKS